MKNKFLALFVLLALLAVTHEAYAPIYSPFPGLEDLIAWSDVIAVVRILKGAPSPHGGYAEYDVKVEELLKGTLPQDKMSLSLRCLPFLTSASRTLKVVFLDDEFTYYSQHIVFLEKAISEDKAVTYYSLNCEGGHMPVSPYWRLRKAEHDSIKSAISELLHDYVSYKRAELLHIEERTKIILDNQE